MPVRARSARGRGRVFARGPAHRLHAGGPELGISRAGAGAAAARLALGGFLGRIDRPAARTGERTDEAAAHGHRIACGRTADDLDTHPGKSVQTAPFELIAR